MKYIRLTLISFALGSCLAVSVHAQTSRAELLAHLDLASGNYCNYPNPTGHITPAPEGYKPFYVSHYGRHGARYQTDDKSYKYVIGKMDTAQMRGFLSDKGREVLVRLKLAAADAKGQADGVVTWTKYAMIFSPRDGKGAGWSEIGLGCLGI